MNAMIIRPEFDKRLSNEAKDVLRREIKETNPRLFERSDYAALEREIVNGLFVYAGEHGPPNKYSLRSLINLTVFFFDENNKKGNDNNVMGGAQYRIE